MRTWGEAAALPAGPLLHQPSYDLGLAFDWAQGVGGWVGEVRVEAMVGLPGGTPMLAQNVGGQKVIRYDPTLTGQVPRGVAYFMFLHELAHLDLREQYGVFTPQRAKELQADDAAALHIVTHNPHLAKQALAGVVAFFRARNAPASDSHPADAARAERVAWALEQLSRLRGVVMVRGDANISIPQTEGALMAMGFQDSGWMRAKIDEARRTGLMVVANLDGGALSFEQIAEALARLDTYEKACGLRFAVDVTWTSLRPQEIFDQRP